MSSDDNQNKSNKKRKAAADNDNVPNIYRNDSLQQHDIIEIKLSDLDSNDNDNNQNESQYLSPSTTTAILKFNESRSSSDNTAQQQHHIGVTSDVVIIGNDNNNDNQPPSVIINQPTVSSALQSSNTTMIGGVAASSLYAINYDMNVPITDHQSTAITRVPVADPLMATTTLTATATAASDSQVGSMTGRPPIQLYLSFDDDAMSIYQCFIRKHIELFEARIEDVESNTQGRNKPITLGQVGVRCRHCNVLYPTERKRGAVYYPAKLDGVYQAAINIATVHLGDHCQRFDDTLRQQLIVLRMNKSSGGGGRKVWAKRAAVLGVYEDDQGLRFEPSINYRQRNYLDL
jgi:hypothetical protein